MVVVGRLTLEAVEVEVRQTQAELLMAGEVAPALSSFAFPIRLQPHLALA